MAMSSEPVQLEERGGVRRSLDDSFFDSLSSEGVLPKEELVRPKMLLRYPSCEYLAGLQRWVWPHAISAHS